MAHDMRGPLATLTGTSDMLGQGVYGELTAPQVRANERIQRSSARMVALLDDFILYVKAEVNQVPFDAAPFEPRVLLDRLRDQITPMAESKKLALHWSVADDLPRVLRSDSALVSRIMLALLWNAVGFTETGGVWLDSGWSDEDQWVTTVRDSGPGIPAEDRPNIFKPFFRGDRRPQMPTSGMGLGLAMAFSLAHMLGGQLTLVQTGTTGSTFRLQLPLPVDEE